LLRAKSKDVILRHVRRSASAFGPLLALAVSFLHGKSAVAGIATMNTVGILGGFFGPLGMGLAKDLTGSYQRGLLMLIIPTTVAASTIFLMRSRCIQTNASL
jgi:MFS transporter, ACS family, tartrate transporter